MYDILLQGGPGRNGGVGPDGEIGLKVSSVLKGKNVMRLYY